MYRLKNVLEQGIRSALLISLCVILSSAVLAAGENDPTFNGAAYGDLTNGGSVHVVKSQADGKILVGGKFTEIQGRPVGGLARINADGTVDTTFNPPSFFGFAGAGGIVYTIVVLPDGKILVGGDIYGTDGVTRPGVRRLNADGTIDSSFFIEPMQFLGGGIVYDMELQTDGKIMIGGFIYFNPGGPVHLARLNSDGTRDPSFPTPAALNDSWVKDIEIQPDGKIVAAGYFGLQPTPPSARVFRFNTDGSLDMTFSHVDGGNGSVEALELLPDGKMIIAGGYTTLRGANQGRVSRLNADGSLDSNFNPSGTGANAVVNDVAIRADGKILLGGNFASYNSTPMQRIARLNADGTLDNTFTNSAAITDTAVNDIELLPDNRFFAGSTGTPLTNPLLRFNADGALDTTFTVLLSTGGIVHKIVVQPDGKILAAGSFRYANGVERRSLARFNADGTLDTSFVPYFNNHNPLPVIYSLALQADGKIIVGAWHGVVLQRLNSDGSHDSTFQSPLTSSSQVYDVLVLPDGKIMAGGNMVSSRPRLAKFNPDGSFDTTYNPPQPSGRIHKMMLRPDGKLLVGGVFGQIADIAVRNGMALYTAEGSLDNGFIPGSGAITTIDFDLQSDGKVVQVGTGMRRLNVDGSVDPSFSIGANSEIDGVKIQPDGKVIVVGGFSVIANTAKNGIARFNINGTIDPTFITHSNSLVYEVEQQSDGKILIGGQFTRINGQPNARIERLLNAAVAQRKHFDYDGDGKDDISVFRPSENRWYIFKSSDSTVTQTVFAIAGDVPVPADYDGDLKTDVAIYRPSTGAWWYLASSNGAQINVNWGGEAGDVPRPSDFDGDGKSDFIIFRPTNNTWYRINGVSGITSNVQFGLAGDKPVRGDFDGDGKGDIAIYRPSTGDWWYLSSLTGAQLAVRWGISTDIPAPADFDGDGRTDFAVFRPSTGVWYVINSSNGSFLIGPFGTPEDKPVPADYDGDGKAELAVFRPSSGIWYQLRTNGGFFAMQFGVGTDTPTPNAFVP